MIASVSTKSWSIVYLAYVNSLFVTSYSLLYQKGFNVFQIRKQETVLFALLKWLLSLNFGLLYMSELYTLDARQFTHPEANIWICRLCMKPQY